MTTVAVCGLGIMGNGMARNLLKAGYSVTVYNRSASRAAPFAALGARIASSPRDAAQDADVIISMVAEDTASREVWLGEQGGLAGAKPGALCIECSTLTPGWVRELAQHATAHGCELLDAPVTGSRAQAEGGELNFYVGGNATALERARDVLLAMGKGIYHIGPTGSGATMKLLNNLIGGVQQVVLAEAIALAESSELDLEQVAQLLADGPIGSPLVKRKLAPLLAHDYATAFSLRLMHKDMTYALAEAAAHTVPMPTVAAAREVMRMGLTRGWGDEDVIVVHELFCPQDDDD